MLNITRFTVEGLVKGCVTDEKQPRFSFALNSGRENAALKRAVLRVGDWEAGTDGQIAVPYGGPALKPFTVYTASITAEDDAGETAQAQLTFETGRLDTPWSGKWISDPAYQFTEKKVSPRPMTFRKRIRTDKKIVSARICATAMGIYELAVNGKKAGDRWFAPGFTSYQTNLQYQTYDVTDMLTGDDVIQAVVAGGWAVGSFVFTRANRNAADRQALLLELRLTYEDGSVEATGTDETWEVTEEGPYQMADLYDGETYDATVREEDIHWRLAAREALRVRPQIVADYGAPVKAHERFAPVSCKKHPSGVLIYDFGQNFAGVVELKLNGRKGQVVTVRHAEILNPDGTLNTAFLRTAKATVAYTCADGEQTYSPRLTYMGFRYISVEGIDQADVEVTGVALYSDLEQIGSFTCSNEMLNQLQSNIVWGAKSNLVDIPTDCPQRDERMGWTGDIAVFSPTACYNFDMGRFLNKWMLDVKAEQFPGGGIPNTVPRCGYGFPATMPDMAVDWWDDACVLVPWAEYRARGDVEILRKYYPVMKKYVKACTFWAGLLSTGKNKYIWHTPSVFHFGDWVAPDVPKMGQWQARSKWTATASLRNTSGLVARIAEILGEKADAAQYRDLSEKVADAYCDLLTDGNGKLLEEFQTAYVLPLYLDMFPSAEVKAKAADNLVKLVEKNDYCIGTGFPGTPYILFTFADSLASFADRVYAAPGEALGPEIVLATVLFGLQIYCDFSGYSDIARGAARLLGVRLTENFRRPCGAATVRDFWRRWHISLTSWFTDYVYIPLGGSRRGLPRQVRGILTVFLLSGLWHGAGWTFVVWGLIHGLYQAAGVIWERWKGCPVRGGALDRLRTFLLVSVPWLFFRAPSISDALTLLSRLPTGWSGLLCVFAQIWPLSLPLLCLPLAERLSGERRRRDWYASALTVFCAVTAVGTAWLAHLAGGGNNAFIYFQF